MDVEYKIIGGDGAEYGPATLEELRSWIGDGRVAGFTQVWRTDLSYWLPAARYVELQQALAQLHASAPAVAASALARPVGFWPRLGAYLIDRILLILLMSLMWSPIANWQHWTMPVLPETLDVESYQKFVDEMSLQTRQMFPFLLVLVIGYDVAFNGSFGATPGKMAIGARILRADGAPLSYARALLRSLSGRLTEALFYFGYLWVAFRRDKRGMHDIIASTRVVFLR